MDRGRMAEDELPEYWTQFWKLYAESFIFPLKSNELLSRFTANPNVTGLYAEAWIRSMAKNMIPHLRVSNGAVIRSSDQTRDLKSIPQCDLIIWDPSELPALFEQDDFALVPTQCVHAIIEIKRTCSKIEDLVKQLEGRKKLLRVDCRKHLLGVVIRHSGPLFDGEVRANWLLDDRWRQDYPIVSLLSADTEPNSDDIMAFIYFLAQIAGHRDLAS
jgi:hypothetical protein